MALTFPTRNRYLVVVFVTLLVTGIVLFTRSKRTQTTEVKQTPYPGLSAQRKALEKKPLVTPTRILDSARIVNDLIFLSSDTCEGRRAGSPGHSKAVARIVQRMKAAGLDSFKSSMVHNFNGSRVNGTRLGKNIIGWLRGTEFPESYILISAHYDHLGKVGNETFFGADDNASGVACLLALADYFSKNPHPYSLVFAAFDREESGLEGSGNYIHHYLPPEGLRSIKFNLNIDMIGRNKDHEIFACGVAQNPSLAKIVEAIQPLTNSKFMMGHDTGAQPHNWLGMSDHYVFHQRRIPFLYVGVEDHEDYHKPTDTYEKFDLGWYIENCNLVALIAKILRP